MLFVLIAFALGTEREPSLQWNMGFKIIPSYVSRTNIINKSYFSHLTNRASNTSEIRLKVDKIINTFGRMSLYLIQQFMLCHLVIMEV